MLDKDGNRIEVPIKASDFHFKPTQKNLQPRFLANDTSRANDAKRVKNSIDFAIYSRDPLSKLVGVLSNDGIDTVLRRNEERRLYRITYIDHHTKCVSNGSVLGKQYSAKGITERCATIIFLFISRNLK